METRVLRSLRLRWFLPPRHCRHCASEAIARFAPTSVAPTYRKRGAGRQVAR